MNDMHVLFFIAAVDSISHELILYGAALSAKTEIALGSARSFPHFAKFIGEHTIYSLP